MPGPETFDPNVAPPPAGEEPPPPKKKEEEGGAKKEEPAEPSEIDKKLAAFVAAEELKRAKDQAAAGAKDFADTQSPGPPGSPGGRQRYNVGVPYSESGLTLGASAGQGGAGASLTTDGSVLVDSKGPADIQAAGALAMQTNAALALLSLGGTTVGTPASIQVSAGAQVQVWAGAAVSPGACGTGAAGAVSGPTKSPGPAGKADTITQLATLPVSGAKLFSDVAGLKDSLKNAKGAVETVKEVLKDKEKIGAAADVVSDLSTVGGVALSTTGQSTTATDVIGAGADALSAYQSGSIFGAVAAAAGGAAGVAAAANTEVDIQGPAGIRMLTAASITGTAANTVEFKAVSKFAAIAGVLNSFQSRTFSAFAICKADMKGCAWVEISSMGESAFAAKVIEIQGKARLNILGLASVDFSGAKFEAKFGHVTFKTPKATLRSKVTIDHDLVVLGNGTLSNDLRVDAEAKSEGNTTVKGNAKFRKLLESPKAKVKGVFNALGLIKADP